MSSCFLRRVGRFLALSILALIAPLAHALSMGISANPDPVRPGEGMLVAIVVTNDTALSINAVSVKLQMPASGVNTVGQSYGSSGASCPNGDCNPGESVEWNLGTLPPGRGMRVTMPLVVSSSTAAGTAIPVAGRVFVGGVQTLAETQNVTVSADNALSLKVDADRDGALPGSLLTYDLLYGNRSGTAVDGSTLALPLPAGTTFVSASGGGALSGNTVLWSLGTLQGGQSGRQQVVVSVAGGLASGTLLPVAPAQLEAVNGFGLAEQARATLKTRIQTGTALGLTIAPNSDPARPGEAARTAVTVTNASSQQVANVVLKLRLPADGFATIEQEFSSNGAGCPSTDCNASEFVSWNLGTLAPGGSTTVLMLSRVSDGFASGRLIALEADLRADNLPLTIGRHSIAVDADNAMTLALSADKDPVAPGDTLTYALTYGNRGGAELGSVSMALPLPPGATFVSATGGGAFANSTVRWTLPNLLAGQSTRQQVVVSVGSGLASGTPLPVDAARIDATSATTGAETARATLATRVHALPTLGLAIASNADPARPNEAVRTAFTVSNRSSTSPLVGTTLKVRVPTEGFQTIGQSYFTGGAGCPNGDCNGYEFANWSLGTIAPGGSVTVSMIGAVSDGFESGRLIAFESLLTADGAPTVVGRRTLAVDGDNALTLALHADRDSAAPGERVTFMLDYANRSTGTITGSVLAFPIPAGATLVASSGGMMTSRSVTFSLGSLLAGTGGRRSVTVAVPIGAPAGTRLAVDAATLSGASTTTGAEAARATLNPRVVADNPLRLSLVSLLGYPVLPGQTLTATLRVSNLGAVPLNTVGVKARVPTEGVNTFGQSALGSGGQCPNGDCNPYEFATWSVPSLAAGASATFTMPMTVSSGFPTGRQIWLQAIATDDNGDESLASGTALVGTQFSAPPGMAVFGDFDANGVVGFSDLALFNAAFGSSNPTYDLDGNGVVNFGDLAIFKSLFGSSLTAGGAAGGVAMRAPAGR